MIRWLVEKLVGAVVAPITRLGEKYLQNQADQARIEAGLQEVAIRADARVRQVKLGYLLGRAPLFLAEVAAGLYFAAVMLDSTFPSDFINPLKLPDWFQPHFGAAIVSIFGAGVAHTAINKFSRKP